MENDLKERRKMDRMTNEKYDSWIITIVEGKIERKSIRSRPKTRFMKKIVDLRKSSNNITV